jgi:hypothetical protein
MRPLTRNEFPTSAAGLAGAVFIGLQPYTVRSDLKADFVVGLG